MVKTDFKILITGVVVVAFVMLADIPATVRTFNDFAAGVAQIKDLPFFKSLDKLKDKEKTVWARLKGETYTKPEDTATTTDTTDDTSTPDTSTPDTTTDGDVQAATDTIAKITSPAKVVLVGDSMMLVGFGPSLETKLLKYNGISVLRDGRYSTGLNRKDYFDWYAQTTKDIKAFKATVLIVMFGANDGQGILDAKGKAYQLTSANWDTIYRQRVNDYMKQMSPQVKRIYWVGSPIPKDCPSTNTSSFCSKFKRENKIYKEEASKFPNIEYINSWDRFAINGKYAAILKNDAGKSQLVKGSDGVHVTNFGGDILTDLVIKNMNEVMLIKK